MLTLMLLLLGCDPHFETLDITIESAVELPPLEDSSLLTIVLESRTEGTSQWRTLEPDCLLDPGWCEVEWHWTRALLGRQNADGAVWLDLDGDDENLVERALLDRDLLDVFWLDLDRDSPTTSVDAVLNDPELAYEDQDPGYLTQSVLGLTLGETHPRHTPPIPPDSTPPHQTEKRPTRHFPSFTRPTERFLFNV